MQLDATSENNQKLIINCHRQTKQNTTQENQRVSNNCQVHRFVACLAESKEKTKQKKLNKNSNTGN